MTLKQRRFNVDFNARVYNATSDWVTSKMCDGIFCDILSEIRRHHVTLHLIGWHLVLRSSQHLSLCANSTFFQQKKMNKCIRMGITAFKIVIWGGKSADASP